MNIQRAAPVNELLAKILFLIIPTAIVGYFLLWNISQYFGVIGNPGSGLFAYLPGTHNISLIFSFFFLAGMVGSAVFHAFRFRFLVPFLLLLFASYTIYQGIDSLATGEFDAFFISNQFRSFSALFMLGWLAGWGFMRLRYFSIIVAASLLCACILLIAKSKTDTVEGLLMTFSPALLYAVYIIFTSEQIYSYKDKSQKFWWFLTRRMLFFGLLAALLLGSVVYVMRREIKETVANYGGGGKEGKNSMLKKNKDGTFDLEQYTRLRGSLGRSNELLFCAHIDNYFPNTDIPNPLYLTAFHYNVFDTSTETFEKDTVGVPKNDLFEPKPNRLPLFFTKTDSTVIRNAMGDQLRRTVEIEVYSKSLSPETYLAPSTGFFVQPITVEKDFKDEFKTAFRAKSYVSELNSAYFIYNSENPQIRAFQEKRFEVLREVTDYTKVDKPFMSYYTRMPRDAKFQKITELAQKITAKAHTPVDRVLAIRDYFLSKDENGERLFSYTDNPGIPDIPSASKLMYFLFENRKGYCAYYAGATLFMLRSLGIPSRITVGFLTVERSSKNPGWYWYYADQAHAWVQVYFPGYGWLDFDTTVGNDEAQESPKPDGTPPMQPPKAILAAEGTVENIDTLKKLMTMQVKSMVFHDKEYDLEKPVPVSMDLKIAAIRIDSASVPISAIVKGDMATAVSYADDMKKIAVSTNENGVTVIARFPKPAPIDEVYLKRKDQSKPPEKEKAPQEKKVITTERVLRTLGMLVAAILLLLLLLPTIIYQYYRSRYKNAGAAQQAYWAYRASTFYLHQVGIFRKNETPMYYANRIVDPQFGTSFSSFMIIYLKQKYAKQPLTDQEHKTVKNFLTVFIKTIKNKLPFRQRLAGFINPVRSVSYFVKPQDEENEG
ncbi:MAG TPA: transglutaminase-like domain-containing protein [Flavipsychrobacter sp.]|nr:transglutaminase-like domain-containing protein [Flavipsychrobacter sp.]